MGFQLTLSVQAPGVVAGVIQNESLPTTAAREGSAAENATPAAATSRAAVDRRTIDAMPVGRMGIPREPGPVIS